MEREVGGGIGMGNTCKPMAVSFQCMTKSTTNKKLKKKKKTPAIAGDTHLIPGLGESHMPQSDKACVPQLLKPANLEPVFCNKRNHCNEKPEHRNKV